MSARAFLDMAARMLDAYDVGRMSALHAGAFGIGPDGEEGAALKARTLDGGFSRGWREWEVALRLNLARLRAARLGRDVESMPEAPSSPSDAAAAAARAMEAENPLEGEAVIDRARWNAAESMQGADVFHPRAVFAYLVKLMILERQASFQAEAGFSQYRALYDAILERHRASGEESTGEEPK